MQERVQNLEGLLRVLHETLATLNQARTLLQHRKDTESIFTLFRVQDVQSKLAYATKDLSQGVLDLGQYSFDKQTHMLVFSVGDLALAEVQEVQESELSLTREISPEQEALFDFDGIPGDFSESS